MSLKDWRKIKNRRIGNNISIIYKKGDITLELFRDALWHNKNMNVIIRDKKISSYESSLGKDIQVEYFYSEEEAKDFAEEYIETH